LVKALRGLLGEEPAAPPKFFPAHDARPATKVLRRLVLFTAQKLDVLPDDFESSPVIEELKQNIIMSFLFSNISDFSPRLEAKPKDAAPWQVRAVEEYISANWDKPLDIATLASVTGASGRSIFQSFARARGYSPMVFLKQTRLTQARARLLAGDPQTSVTAVALACGFHNLGYFAQDYFAAFGERPSETLSGASRR
jgi:transcriptional regulator GlxA family with amidase domain